MKKTGWYEGYQKPVRAGVYEREFYCGKLYCTWYCTWDGRKWMAGSRYKSACASLESESVFQNLRWRGMEKT